MTFGKITLAAAAAAACITCSQAAFSKPAMGWSTWNTLACGITEQNIADNVNLMVQLGLPDVGWVGLHIDDCWASGRYPNGSIIPDPKVFPSGFQKTIDTIKNAGMQLGMYTARGAITCQNRPGIMGYEAQDAAQFKAWGVQYLKLDSCGQYGNRSAWQEYSLIGSALRAAGAAPYVELCEQFAYDTTNHSQGNPVYPGVAYTTGPWLSEGLPVDTIADALLVEWVNMADNWRVMMSNLDAQFQLAARAMTYAGLTNHMDMMTICSGGMSVEEYKSQMSLWSIMTSPLILGNDFAKTDVGCINTVMKNTEVIAVNQDDTVRPADLTLSTYIPQGVAATLHMVDELSGKPVTLHAQAVPVSVWWQVYQKSLSTGQLSVAILCRDGPTTAQELLTRHICASAAVQEAEEQWAGVCGGARGTWSNSTRLEVSMQSAATGRTLHRQVVSSPTDPITYPFNVSLPMLGLPSTTSVSVRDLWAHTDNGTYTGAVPLPPLYPHQIVHINLGLNAQ